MYTQTISNCQDQNKIVHHWSDFLIQQVPATKKYLPVSIEYLLNDMNDKIPN